MSDRETAVVRYDPFSIMDRLDDDAIVAELEGQIIQALVYQIKDKSGRVTEGLSKAGVDACCREMARQGEVLRELELEVTETATEYLAKCKVGRYAVRFNPETGETREVLLDTAFGVKRQPKYYEDGKSNPFAYEQACMKAARNAKMRLLTEELKQKVIALARKEGRVKVHEEQGNGGPQKAAAKPRAREAAAPQAPPANGDKVKAAWLDRIRKEVEKRSIDDQLLCLLAADVAGIEDPVDPAALDVEQLKVLLQRITTPAKATA